MTSYRVTLLQTLFHQRLPIDPKLGDASGGLPAGTDVHGAGGRLGHFEGGFGSSDVQGATPDFVLEDQEPTVLARGVVGAAVGTEQVTVGSEAQGGVLQRVLQLWGQGHTGNRRFSREHKHLPTEVRGVEEDDLHHTCRVKMTYPPLSHLVLSAPPPTRPPYLSEQRLPGGWPGQRPKAAACPCSAWGCASSRVTGLRVQKAPCLYPTPQLLRLTS